MLLGNPVHARSGRASVVFSVAIVLCLVAASLSIAPLSARAQDDSAKPEVHGRKYKPPPTTSNIEVTVLRSDNQKPIMNASVVFHPVKDGQDEGFMELKTKPDGKASIDIIPTGSKVTIQVIAEGFATYGEDYQIDQPSRQIVIKLIRPRAQVSSFVDNSDKPSQMPPGEQVPIRPAPVPPATPSGSTTGAAPQP